MRAFWFILSYILIASCSEDANNTQSTLHDRDTALSDSVIPSVLPEKDSTKVNKSVETLKAGPFSNERFKEVMVERIGDTYRVKGKAQVFEAAFSWVIEDGHNQLKKGFDMTDAGAPEFGNFEFRFSFNKKENTSPHLILFESSAKDGSPQHELPIPLP